MKSALRIALQALFYLPLMALVGYFSRAPQFTHIGEDEALLRLSIAHATERRYPCRRRTAEELAKLPPNLRAPEDCPRERAPLAVELEVNGEVRLRTEVQPAGLQRDGLAMLYHRMTLPAGEHRIAVRMRDRVQEGYNHVREERVLLAGGDALLIDFDAARGRLEFRR
jgi:hypothetical protein